MSTEPSTRRLAGTGGSNGYLYLSFNRAITSKPRRRITGAGPSLSATAKGSIWKTRKRIGKFGVI
jgi:hypothetical protein